MSRLAVDYDASGWTVVRRAVAVAVDLVLVAVIGGTLSAPMALFAGFDTEFASGVLAIITLAYFTALEAYSGQTLGKKALGLAVVTDVIDESVAPPDGRSRGGETGETPDVVAAAIRNLLRFVDWLPAFYLLGAVLIAVTERDQRLGDLAADTVVVRVRRSNERDGDVRREDEDVDGGANVNEDVDEDASVREDVDGDANTGKDADESST